MRIKLRCGDCRDVLKRIPDGVVHSIVTDPPYELKFMGRAWDATGIAYDVGMWKECLRVLKPGGHLLSFGHVRTYHRMVCAVEDAGFEIRDTISWVYGQGMSKGVNVQLMINKMERGNGMGKSDPHSPHHGQYKKGSSVGAGASAYKIPSHVFTDQKKWGKPFGMDMRNPDREGPWEGWNPTLKPATELICVARKALDGTIADNVLKHGVGALHVDACRIQRGQGDVSNLVIARHTLGSIAPNDVFGKRKRVPYNGIEDRYPANLIHDGSPHIVSLFPEKAGGGHWPKSKTSGFGKFGGGKSTYKGQGPKDGLGSASRFFKQCEFTEEDYPRFIYCAKPSSKERRLGLRDANSHKTIKPIMLLRYLVRLVTPLGGWCLDPFMGSGTTGMACCYEGMRFYGIEKESEHYAICKSRIRHAYDSSYVRDPTIGSSQKRTKKR